MIDGGKYRCSDGTCGHSPSAPPERIRWLVGARAWRMGNREEKDGEVYVRREAEWE